jgi:hypothetical protein
MGLWVASDHLAPYAERLGSFTLKPEAEHFLARQHKKFFSHSRFVS